MRWIVSAENNPYMAWQCLLFRHSALTRCGVEPTFVIHETNQPLDPLFKLIAEEGFLVHAPSYRTLSNGCAYPPRNNPGTLLEISRLFKDDWFVLFDPDMIFTRNLSFRSEWSADCVEYGPENMRLGVPYGINRQLAAPLAKRWLERIDADKSSEWTVSMWAFVQSCWDLGINHQTTNYCETNYHPASISQKSIIHYCYDSAKWTKRAFLNDSRAVFKRVPTGHKNSVEEHIFRQLRETATKLLGHNPNI